MSEKRIKFTVKKNGGGAFKVETEGFTGSSCDTAVDGIIASVGGRVTDGGDKEERYHVDDPSAFVDAVRQS